MDIILRYFMLFFCYSFFGWCLEVMCKLVQYKRFINRGFLLGPYCPIYGVGGILITIMLGKYESDPAALFIFAIIISGVLEYYTSYLMEKIFHARWWDYSGRMFNINGRVCLETLVPFGIFGMITIYVVNPFIYSLFDMVSIDTLNTIAIALMSLMLIDLGISSGVLVSVRKENKVLDKDNTEEMAKIVRDKLRNRSILTKRLLDAFPTVRHIGIILKKEKHKLQTNIFNKKQLLDEKQRKIKEKTDERLQKLRNEYEYRARIIKERSERKR